MLSAALLLGSCRQGDEDGEVVARAYGNVLYAADVAGLVGEGVSPEDSATIVHNYVNQWILQQVVLEKARRNIDKDFSSELQNYKNSLLIYEYEQMIVAQLLDTNVSEEEIQLYYDNHRDNFVLKNNIVRVMYVKLPKDCKYVAKMRTIFSRNAISDADMIDAQKIAAVYAVDCSFDIETWMPFYRLQTLLPIETYNEALYLRSNHCISITDGDFIYLAHIFEYKVVDDLSPLEFEHDNIRSIIINSRKIDIIKSMQRDLLNEAQRGGRLHISD